MKNGGNRETLTVDEATERLIDYRGKTPPKTDSGVRLITAKVVKRGRILETKPEFIAADFYDQWMRRGLPQQWDVLITTEAPLGEVAILRTPDKIALAQRIILLRGDPRVIDQRYLFYALQSEFTQAELQSRATGTTVRGIKQSELRQVRLQLPDLPTQRKIAGILSAYDDLIENNLRRIRILEEMAQSLYREWFVHFRFPGHQSTKMTDSPLGPIPEGWEVKKVKEVTEYLSRGLAPKYDENGPSTVINQKCIRDERLSLDKARRQCKPIPPDKQVRRGDVLVNSTGVGTLGRVAQVEFDPTDCTVDTHVTILRPLVEIDSCFFGQAMFSLHGTFDRLGAGATGQTELSRASIGDIDLALPPEDLQQGYGVIARPIRAAIITQLVRNETLRQTRDLLLPKLLG